MGQHDLSVTEDEVRCAFAEALNIPETVEHDDKTKTITELAKLLNLSYTRARDKAARAVAVGAMRQVLIEDIARDGRSRIMNAYQVVKKE